MAWQEVSDEHYYDMLDIVPPAIQVQKGFLVGEPCDMRICKVRNRMAYTYTAFVWHGNACFKNDEPMTAGEFLAFCPATINL